MTIKPILLNADGALPNGLTLEKIQRLGLTSVHPAQRPTAAPGFQIVEGEPVQDVSGVWRQTWQTTPMERSRLTSAEVWESIKAHRDRLRFQGGVKVGDHWFKSDEIAASEYTALALISASLPATAVLRKGWRTMGGPTVDMTPELVRQIIEAGFAQVAAIDNAAQMHRAAMESSANPGEYDFSGGWPAVFEGGVQ